LTALAGAPPWEVTKAPLPASSGEARSRTVSEPICSAGSIWKAEQAIAINSSAFRNIYHSLLIERRRFFNRKVEKVKEVE
jgi:hypothetical protein